MKRRTILFHRRFPNKRIAVTSLRRFYLKHGLRRKRIRMEKVMPPAARAVFVESCRNLLEKMRLVTRQGRLMVFLDEIVFTKLSLQKKEWSQPNENLSVN
jgi:hypothetical protein